MKIFFLQKFFCVLLYLTTSIKSHEITILNKVPSIVPIYGNVQDGFYVKAEIGTPPQLFNLLLDTGSANLALISAPFLNSSYFIQNKSFSLQKWDVYLQMSINGGGYVGSLATDFVALRGHPHFGILSSLALISAAYNFFPPPPLSWQGVLGLGYKALIQPTLPANIPYLEQLTQSFQLEDKFSMVTCDPIKNKKSAIKGSLGIGGVDASKLNGNFQYTPIVREKFYEVSLVGLQVGKNKWDGPCTTLNVGMTILDTGSSKLCFIPEVYHWAIKQLQSQTKEQKYIPPEFWERSKPICREKAKEFLASFPTLTYTFPINNSAEFKLELSPEVYLQQVKQPDVFSGNIKCFALALCENPNGTVIGRPLLSEYYVEYDRAHKRVGFAHTTCSQTIRRVAQISSPHLLRKNQNYRRCVQSLGAKNDEKGINYTAIVLGVIAFACFVPILSMLIFWLYNKIRPKREAVDHFFQIAVETE